MTIWAKTVPAKTDTTVDSTGVTNYPRVCNLPPPSLPPALPQHEENYGTCETANDMECISETSQCMWKEWELHRLDDIHT